MAKDEKEAIKEMLSHGKDSLGKAVHLEILDTKSDPDENSSINQPGTWRDLGPIELLPDIAESHSVNDDTYQNRTSQDKQQLDEKAYATYKEKRVKPLSKSLVKLLGGPEHYSYRHSLDGIDSNILILLHGSGDTHAPYDRLAKTMALPQTACLSISASLPGKFVTIPFDLGYTWFEHVDYFQTGMELPTDHPRRVQSMNKAISIFREILRCLIDDNGWTPERIFFLGFSCGAELAMEIAMDRMIHNHGKPHISNHALGGIICIAGGIQSSRQNRAKQNEMDSIRMPTPILIIVGSKDPIYTTSKAKQSKSIYDTYSFTSLNQKDTKMKMHNKSNDTSNIIIHLQKNKIHAMISSSDEMSVIMGFLANKLVRRSIGFGES